jgi:TorA maturation chaperone TorD
MDMNGTVIPLQEAVNIFYARQYAYDILRRFFVEEPTKEYLKPFVQKNMIDLFPFKEDSKGIQEGINDIKTYLSTHDVVHIDRDFQELHWDYTRLFVGPFELPTPPWESSYVRKDGLLFQGTTMEIRKYYEKYGMLVSDFNIEADDHIGLELDFIYQLNELCIKLAESNEEHAINDINHLLREQHKFINDHLLKFVPDFCHLVTKEANSQFFVGLAKILNHFTKMDSEVLQEMMNIDIL